MGKHVHVDQPITPLGQTSLHCAVCSSKPAVIYEVIKRGANVNSRDTVSSSPHWRRLPRHRSTLQLRTNICQHYQFF